MKKPSAHADRQPVNRIKRALKQHVHLPLILLGERIAGRRYARNPKKRAEELFRKAYGRPLDWNAPELFVEKVRWIQFNTDISLWALLADKLRARDYVARKGHSEILVPLLGQWDSASDIDFSALPRSFVIKPNNGCSDLFIVTDKEKSPLRSIRRKLARSLRTTYGSFNAETHYSHISPAILAEELMPGPEFSRGVPDYKFYCVGGEPVMCMVCTDRDYAGPDTKRATMYDMEWNRRDDWMRSVCVRAAKDIPRPSSFERMKEICRDLTAGIPFVRLDLYDDRGTVRFGEFTFTPAALKRSVTMSDAAMQYIADRIDIPDIQPPGSPSLSVTISTMGPDGIERVAAMNLPQVSGVEYIVSWQKHDDMPVPQSILRDDIKIVRTSTIGLSNNRNNAISHAIGEVILIADDDLTYRPEQLQAIIDAFRYNPDIDIASFRYNKPLLKRYPDRALPFDKLPKGYHPASIEIAFRRKLSLGVNPLKFNPSLGLGAPYLRAGEEDLFLMQAAARGYRGMYFPIEITTHNGVATGGRRATDPGVLRANGAVIAMRRPWLWPVAVLVNSLRISRAGRAPVLRAAAEMTKGAIYGLRHLKV